jgi:uncharacterized repeat protein (TIGR03806 family)
MKNNYFLKSTFFLLLFSALLSCGSDDSSNPDKYEEIPQSPVVVDLARVPYDNLSQYKFYEGDMKNLTPAYGVLPYDLSTPLFTDYAHKKRFVWMPEGTSATYAADGKILDFPVGAVLIKNFYYDNVQPANTTRIIETRLLINTADGWIFANYVWNEAQTEAELNMNGMFTDVAWVENGVTKSTSYRIPSHEECFTCHKQNEKAVPIGPKPQNLNKLYAYSDGSRNQLSKWIEEGYLNTAPQTINSAVDWADESQPLELRVRSYLDINCAHCHSEGAHCDYVPIRFAFSETANPVNMGVCVQPFQSSQAFIVAAGSAERSAMHARMNTNEESQRMPLMGRTIIHEEGVNLIEQWITSMENPCP